MSEKDARKVKKVPARRSGQYSLLIILVMLVLILVPTFIVGSILYDSYMKTGQPIVGQRFDGDLPNKITQEKIDRVNQDLKKFDNIEKGDVQLQSGTLKVYADIRDVVVKEKYPELINAIYREVINTLPVGTYFTRQQNVKNYDLEITIYNFKEPMANKPRIVFILQKNSGMEKPGIYNVGDAKNPALVKELTMPKEQKSDGSTPANETETKPKEDAKKNGN